MKNRVRDGEVHIKMRFEDSIFYFTVEDNGPGMTVGRAGPGEKRMEEGRIGRRGKYTPFPIPISA